MTRTHKHTCTGNRAAWRVPALSVMIIFAAAWSQAYAQQTAPVAEDSPAVTTADDIPSAATQSSDGAADTDGRARVVRVVGTVRHRQIGDDRWTATQIDDMLDEGTEVRTGMRSRLELVLHDGTTEVIVESSTRAALTSLLQTGDTETTRVDVKDGAVQASISEGTLRSDFAIRCPGAVLTREGTEGLRLTYDAGTGWFRATLDHGLGRVTRNNRSARYLPGQSVTRLSVEQTVALGQLLERTIPLTGWVPNNEANQYARNQSGAAAFNPNAGHNTYGYVPNVFRSNFQGGRFIGGRDIFIPFTGLPGGNGNDTGRTTIPYRPGNFGTGTGASSGISDLIQSAF